MKKTGLLLGVLLFTSQLFSQHLTGYYESDPQMENYDHFKIHHKKEYLEVRAYIGNGELWTTIAIEVSDSKKDFLIKVHGEGKEITSVHELKVLLDGLDWEFFLLAYEDENGKNQFIVVEEIFMDETEQDLLETHVFNWSHTHHKG